VIRLIAEQLGALAKIPNTGVPMRQKAAERLNPQSLVPARLTTDEADTFLESNHIQGTISAAYHMGLKDADGDIRAIISLNPANDNASEWKVCRYITLGIIPGSLDRLLSYAKRAIKNDGHELTKWSAIVPCDISTGQPYEAAGFVLDKELPPDYTYIDGHQTAAIRMPKETYSPERFKTDPNLIWNESCTEAKAAHANNLFRCWDSGSLRYTKTLD
jgi:hypothetical protein